METKDDISYGVVPVYKNGNDWQVLLIHQISYRGETQRFWTLPKGHPEIGESPTAAALRELQEETGLTAVTLAEEQVFSVQYSFLHEGIRINKKVDYYLGYCTNQNIVITQPEEVMELRWCSFREAIALVPHQNAKDVLQKVATYLDEEIA